MPVPRRGAAFAASQLGKNSVGPKQLKKDSATTAKIKNSAVTTAKIKDGAVTGAKVLDGSLTGADINQATLTSVRASSVTAIQISGDGNCTDHLLHGVRHRPPAQQQSSDHHRGATDGVDLRKRFRTNVLFVDTFLGEGKSDQPFDLILTC